MIRRSLASASTFLCLQLLAAASLEAPASAADRPRASFDSPSVSTLADLLDAFRRAEGPGEAARIVLASHEDREDQDEILRYEDGDWTFADSARSAMNQRRAAFKEAGFVIFSASVFKRSAFPWNAYYVIEYLRPVDRWSRGSRGILRYEEGDWTFPDGPRGPMNFRANALREAGYKIISSTVYTRSEFPWNYFFVIEYVRPFNGREGHRHHDHD